MFLLIGLIEMLNLILMASGFDAPWTSDASRFSFMKVVRKGFVRGGFKFFPLTRVLHCPRFRLTGASLSVCPSCQAFSEGGLT